MLPSAINLRKNPYIINYYILSIQFNAPNDSIRPNQYNSVVPIRTQILKIAYDLELPWKKQH
jgi:hypothetical protein